MSFNPISALTHATLVDICEEPATRELAADMMREAQAIAEKLGVTFRVPLEKRIEGAAKVGKHKTSTLQDIEAGRDVEVDALIGSVIELGTLTATPMPATRAVHAMLKLLVQDDARAARPRRAAAGLDASAAERAPDALRTSAASATLRRCAPAPARASASITALTTAGVAPIVPSSPTPLTPIALLRHGVDSSIVISKCVDHRRARQRVVEQASPISACPDSRS